MHETIDIAPDAAGAPAGAASTAGAPVAGSAAGAAAGASSACTSVALLVSACSQQQRCVSRTRVRRTGESIERIGWMKRLSRTQPPAAKGRHGSTASSCAPVARR
jgi:hypothetical protein